MRKRSKFIIASLIFVLTGLMFVIINLSFTGNFYGEKCENLRNPLAMTNHKMEEETRKPTKFEKLKPKISKKPEKSPWIYQNNTFLSGYPRSLTNRRKNENNLKSAMKMCELLKGGCTIKLCKIQR